MQGSVVSLAAGGVSGAFLLGIAYFAWQDYKQTPVTSKTYPAAALGQSLVAFSFGKRRLPKSDVLC